MTQLLQPPLEPSVLLQLTELSCDFIQEEAAQSMTKTDVEQELNQLFADGYQALIHEQQARIVAFCLYREQAERVFVKRLYTDPAFRNRGIATDFLNRLQRRGLPVSMFVGAHNHSAQAFYKKQGAIETFRALELPATNARPESPSNATPQALMKQYEAALATQQWSAVEPLMHADVCVTFSNGTFRGIDEVRKVFQRNFVIIEDETYAICDVHWVRQTDTDAICLYRFQWTGLIDGQPASGSGRGTTVLVKDDEWRIITEHLGPEAGS
ncbi:GNAT family N-acetyltransferase [Reinekea blandensis]|uniref:N-acetyltransferase domain-containing protein n=1 Tax=Reinekea blandensis MED297 TaxID=314283 RepID=A4BDE8_9GAMM|nr:GNAT family N-acetyltransferase [Reinekea blandensis]EAR09892.1 hypothetical protein MED297_06069 [Reinekea sp. MED297] [Reinekea blandensis MED297]